MTAPLARIVNDPAFSNVVEKRYFQYFRRKTVASTNSLMDSRFWDRIVLQICHVEPAVKHAVLALSSLHQISEARNDKDLALRHQRYADHQYQRALSAAQGLLSSSSAADIDRVLIACLVFTCYDNVRGNYLSSQMHTGSGRAILAEHRDRLSRLSRRNDLNEIQALFARLDIAAMAFSVSNARYPYDSESFYATNPNLIPDAFDSVEGARAPLMDHVRWFWVHEQGVFEAAFRTGFPYESLETERQRVCDHLLRWATRFEKVVEKDANASPILIRTLRVWHQIVSIQGAAHWYGPETRFDVFIPEYERIVTWSEEIIEMLSQTQDRGNFSFDLGTTICLFEAVQRCRDPHIRRRALEALRRGPQQEGTWGCLGAAATAEQWMLYEEAGLGTVEKASDVPDWRRIVNLDASVNAELGVAEVLFHVTPSQGHEDELTMGFLGATTLEGEEPSMDAAIKPFSMGIGHTISFRASFDDRLGSISV